MKGRELPPPSGTNTKPGTEHRQPTLSSAHPASHHNSPNSITQGTFVFTTLLAESLSTALFTPIKAAICVPLNGVLSSNAASFSFAYPRAVSSVTVITGIWGERKMQGALPLMKGGRGICWQKLNNYHYRWEKKFNLDILKPLQVCGRL